MLAVSAPQVTSLQMPKGFTCGSAVLGRRGKGNALVGGGNLSEDGIGSGPVSCLSRWGKAATQGTKALEPLLSPPMSVMLRAVSTVSFRPASSPTGMVLLAPIFTVGLEGDLS